MGTEASSLRSEQNYIKFAQQVGDVLYEGQAVYNIPAFFTELAKGLGSTQLTSLDMKKIVDSVTVAYNAKVAEEKKRDGGKKNGDAAGGMQHAEGTTQNVQCTSHPA